MHEDSLSRDLDAMERRVLRALCSGDLSRSTELGSYKWRNAEHRIVFEALLKIPSGDAATLRELLPAEATRMGFPDVDWARYFVRESVPNSDAAKLVCELLNAAD